MFALVYLLAAAAATADQEAAASSLQRPNENSTIAISDEERMRLRKQGFAEPKGNPGLWVSTADYPESALLGDRAGVTAFRLRVNPMGRVALCEVTVSSGHADLDAATCKYVTERAVFSPALNKLGKPVYGTYENRVRWQIPEVAVPEAGTYTITYIVEADGTVSSCNETVHPIYKVKNCSKPFAFRPPVDETGASVRKRVTYTEITEISILDEIQ